MRAVCALVAWLLPGFAYARGGSHVHVGARAPAFFTQTYHMSVKALEYKDAHTSHTRLRLEPLCPVELSAGILKNVT